MISPDPSTVHDAVLQWYAEHRRDLPWRDSECSGWGVLLSEVMSQQTPIARVEPMWRDWMERWPTPADLAAAPPGEAVAHWGRLGYPRRALRLHEAAGVIARDHGNVVPSDPEVLRSLPGIGDYTAAAVAAFAYGVRTTVVDTNVRRVEARLFSGEPLPAKSLSAAEMRLAESLLPDDDADAATWNVAVMELGALICTAKSPSCETCPVRSMCAWVAAGSPAYDGPPRRGQKWAGTDRQVRGRIVQLLREADAPVPRAEIDTVWHDQVQLDRCLGGLLHDGLVEPVDDELFALPGRH